MRTYRGDELRFGLGMLVLGAVIGCSGPALTVLPENPCDLLSEGQVATAAGVQISKATRVLSQGESIESANSGRQPPAGSICRYETPSELGSIAVIFPDRRGPLGSRSEPPKCGARGPAASAGSSPDGRSLISGGSGSVCVGPDLLVWVSVQMAHERRATDAATGVANAILRRMPR